MVFRHCCVGFNFEFALSLGFRFPRPDICHSTMPRGTLKLSKTCSYSFWESKIGRRERNLKFELPGQTFWSRLPKKMNVNSSQIHLDSQFWNFYVKFGFLCLECEYNFRFDNIMWTRPASFCDLYFLPPLSLFLLVDISIFVLHLLPCWPDPCCWACWLPGAAYLNRWRWWW